MKYDIEVRKLQTYHPALLTFSDLQKNAAMRILQSFGNYGLQQGDEAAAKRPIKTVREEGGRSRCRRCYPIPSQRTETDGRATGEGANKAPATGNRESCCNAARTDHEDNTRGAGAGERLLEKPPFPDVLQVAYLGFFLRLRLKLLTPSCLPRGHFFL